MSKFSVKKPFTVLVAVILVLTLGFISFTKMKTDLLPDMELPYAIVMTTYVGASPEEVEAVVTKPIEQSLATISNIDNISSMSNENVSMVILQFNDSVDMSGVSVDIRENLSLLEADFTDEMIGTPVIMKLNPSMMPVMVAAIDMEGYSNVEISKFAKDEILQRVEAVEGVASVSTQGLIEEEIQVVIREELIDEVNQSMNAAIAAQFEDGITQLEDGIKDLKDAESQLEAAYGMYPDPSVLTQLEEVKAQRIQLQSQLEEVYLQKEETLQSSDISNFINQEMITGILSAQNFSMPAGYLTEDDVTYLTRVGDKVQNLEEIKDLLLFDSGLEEVGKIYLEDVADIFVSDNSLDSYAKVNNNNAVILSIQKQTGYATSDVSKDLLALFDELEQEHEKLTVSELMDQGMYIDIVVDSVLNNLLYGAILAVIILIFFLKDLKPTFMIALSIPISVVFALALMYFSGVSMNIISLSGLAVGVGMLVDNSVVVIENIYRLRSKGVSRIKAAVTGATQVGGAIIASTLTTICVFLPIVFTEGITKTLFVDMGLTIAYSLIASLIVALTVIPAMAAGMLKEIKERKHPVMDLLIRLYDKVLRFCLRFKVLVLLFSVILLAGSIYLAYQNGTAFMPAMDSTQITVDIAVFPETSQEEAQEIGDEAAERILQVEGVETVGLMQGGNVMSSFMGGQGSGLNMSAYVILSEDKERSSQEIAEEINEICSDLNATIQANGSTMDISALYGSGITLEIKGDDLETLQTIASEVALLVSDVEGTVNVSDGMEDADPAIKITVNKEAAMENKLTVAQVFAALAEELSTDQEATTITYEDTQVSIFVEDETIEKLDSISELEQFEFSVTNEAQEESTVKLKEIATITQVQAASSINRDSQQRYMSVTADIAEDANIGIVSGEIETLLKDYQLPNGYTIVSSGEDDAINEAMVEMIKMLLVAVLFIYLIMVAQFQSLLSPFIVMFTIPLAFTGGFLGLFITGFELSVIALLGFVVLAGIGVNNGIVLVDYINQLRIEGMDKKDALLEAGKTRMRPIFMTALTTVLGLSTMAVGVGMGADMVQPIAIVGIFGLLYGTLTTLFVIPVLYDIFHRKPMRVISEDELALYEELED